MPKVTHLLNAKLKSVMYKNINLKFLIRNGKVLLCRVCSISITLSVKLI